MPAAAPTVLDTPPADRRSTGVLLAFALANTGGVIGYSPLLTLLLPIQAEAVAGTARVGLLTAVALAGAVAASLSAILFGWLSDRHPMRGGGRRGWMAGGLVATAASFAGVAAAASAATILVSVVVFQIAVNMVLAPFAAAMAEEIPDGQKGVAGGLLAVGAPLASAIAALVVWTAGDEGVRLALLALAMALCVAPLLAVPRRIAASAVRLPRAAGALRRDMGIAWAARLLVQVSAIALGLHLLYYFADVAQQAPAALAGTVARLQAGATIAAVPGAVLAGRLSDRIGRRKPFLLATAAIAALGLVGMAQAHGWAVAAAGYALYSIGAAIFVALHAGFSMQLLPDPAHRGRDLGIYNLTNTLPSLIGPVLTWWLARPGDYQLVMLALAALTLAGGAMMLAVRARD